MSNPYAPPEDRPRPPDGDRADVPVAQLPWPPPAPRAVPAEPARTPPDPEQVARAQSLTRLFGVLVLSSVLVATLPLPWQAAGLVFALGALVVGVRALVVSVRARAGGLTPMIAVGVVIALFWSFLLILQLALWPMQQAKQECLQGALTISAQNACAAQYDKAVQDLLDSRTTGS
ncbi:hypothetical protein [Cellulomonas sp. ICMP 17802]|uniref:hypothetical protein n=1 Tax=Cellulomonas sp. ICMP 17802 TaxID=3239199 RepID=UPI00351BBE37